MKQDLGLFVTTGNIHQFKEVGTLDQTLETLRRKRRRVVLWIGLFGLIALAFLRLTH